MQPRHDVAADIVRVLVDGIEAHDLAGQDVVAIGEPGHQAVFFQGHHQAHDGALDQTGAIGQFGETQGGIADAKGSENGQDAISRGNAGNAWARTVGVQASVPKGQLSPHYPRAPGVRLVSHSHRSAVQALLSAFIDS